MRHRVQWKSIVTIMLACFVIGNASFTIILYFVGIPERTAWTGHVPQSTPSAVNDLCVGIVILILGLDMLHHER